MEKELKKAIVNYILDNDKEFQIVNTTVDHFSDYIYGRDGEYLIGGERVRDFIKQSIELLTTN